MVSGAFLVALLSITPTSTTTPEWARPVDLSEEEPDEREIVKKRRKERIEGRWSDVRYLERKQRWSRDRGLHLAVHGGLLTGAADAFLLSLDAAIGFSAHLSRRWTLQGRASIGTGYGSEELPLRGDHGPIFVSSADASIRLGPNRFYFGLGPFGRIWRIFDEERGFEYGGGGLAECGWWLGKDRQLDVNVRIYAGAYDGERGRELRLFGGTSFGVGWIL